MVPIQKEEARKSRNKKYATGNKNSLHGLIGRFDIAEEKIRPMNLEIEQQKSSKPVHKRRRVGRDGGKGGGEKEEKEHFLYMRV